MPEALHSIFSKLEWTVQYDTAFLKRDRDATLFGRGETLVLEPFEFRLKGSTKAVTGTHPAQAVFEVEVWWIAGKVEGEGEGDGGGEDRVLRWMLRNAHGLEMTVDHEGDKVGSEFERVMARNEKGDMHLYTLQTVKPLKLVKGGQERLEVNVEVTIEAPGTLGHQLPRLLPIVFPSPLPRPLHIYNNLGSLISRPANLALKVISRLSKHVSYVWASKDELAIASQYLKELVDAENLAGGSSFELVDDDSDDEEETNRRKLEQSKARKAAREAARQAKRRRSDTPEPPEKKQRVDTGVAAEEPVASLNDDITTKNPPVNESAAQRETQPEERIDPQPQVEPIAQPVPQKQQPVTSSPTIMDITEPGEFTRVIDVPNCAISTLQAVVGFILTRQIVFAPLSLDGKKERSSFILESIRENKDAPIPVSPRSVYRLAKRFGLEELASFALADLEKKLSTENAASLALHIDCKHYPQMEKLAHDYVRNNYDSIREAFDRIELQEDYQSILYARLIKPIGGKLNKSKY